MFLPLLYAVPTILVLYGIRKYRETRWGKCTNNVKLDGKVAIVTGANSGIGFEITKELAARNAVVILACRSAEKARRAIEKIKSDLSNEPALVPAELDLTSLVSIKNFAIQIKQKYPKIHLLFNNAGVSYPKTKRVTTVDGFEAHLGVNHLGHFYLTSLLLDTLRQSKSRVIVVASALHTKGEINLNDLNSTKLNKKANLYANSKLANVYFARELAKRNNEINVYAVCPGWVYTGLFRHSIAWWHYILFSPIAFLFMRSPKQGSQTPIYCATEPELEKESGLLYRDCKKYDSKKIFYETTQIKLWEESERMIKEALEKL